MMAGVHIKESVLSADIDGVCFSVCLPLHPGLHSGQHRDSPHHQRQPGADYGHATPRLHHIQGEGKVEVKEKPVISFQSPLYCIFLELGSEASQYCLDFSFCSRP